MQYPVPVRLRNSFHDYFPKLELRQNIIGAITTIPLSATVVQTEMRSNALSCYSVARSSNEVIVF
jgi:hypothetical protein